MDLADDPRFAHNDGRVGHSEQIDGAIHEWTRRHTLDEVLEVLQNADVPSGRIYTAADILDDPHYRARGMIEKHALPDGTYVDFPGTVPKLSETPGGTRSLGPRLGEHTDEILASLGVSGTELGQLRADGII